MKHRVQKFNFKGGKDSSDMMIRKLAVNFLEHGSMVTSEKKGKALSSYMGRLVEKAKTRTEANKNYLLKAVNSEKVVNNLFKNVGPAFKDVVGGYITLKRLQQRTSDGALMIKLAWVKPVLVEEVATKEPKLKEKKTATAEADVKTVAKKKPVKKAVKKAK